MWTTIFLILFLILDCIAYVKLSREFQSFRHITLKTILNLISANNSIVLSLETLKSEFYEKNEFDMSKPLKKNSDVESKH